MRSDRTAIRVSADNPPITSLDHLRAKIDNTSALVFSRRDLDTPFSRSTQTRAIRRAINAGALVRLAPGLYARARRSCVTGRPTPDGSPERVLAGVARCLGVEIRQSQAQRAYNERRSTQVPTGRRVAVIGRPRVRRVRIGEWDFELTPGA